MSRQKNMAVIKAYENLLDSLSNALSAESYGNTAERNFQVDKSIDILHELFAALNFEKGREVAENLGFIYCYVLYSLGRVKTHNDTKPLHDGIRLLSPLYSSWKQLKSEMADEAFDGIHSNQDETKKRAMGHSG